MFAKRLGLLFTLCASAPSDAVIVAHTGKRPRHDTNTAMKFDLVVAQFNKSVIDPMVAAAREEAASLGIEITREVPVPGCYEVPLIVSELLPRKKVDAVVVLGYIERGQTLHGEVMGNVVHKALVDLQITHGKPVGIGIIGPGATEEQAHARKDSYARAAVRAALASAQAIAALDDPKKKLKK